MRAVAGLELRSDFAAVLGRCGGYWKIKEAGKAGVDIHEMSPSAAKCSVELLCGSCECGRS